MSPGGSPPVVGPRGGQRLPTVNAQLLSSPGASWPAGGLSARPSLWVPGGRPHPAASCCSSASGVQKMRHRHVGGDETWHKHAPRRDSEVRTRQLHV